MIILSIILVLLSNAVNIRRDISILFNRIAILILIYCILHDISSLAVVTKGVGLHGGLLLMTNITQIFHIFIFLVSILILQLSIFLAIELQSYGLYILSTIYRNSELSTTGGLIYFLLGGLSSCFILLGTSLLYANSGTTNLDGLYIITSISDLSTNL